MGDRSGLEGVQLNILPFLSFLDLSAKTYYISSRCRGCKI